MPPLCAADNVNFGECAAGSSVDNILYILNTGTSDGTVFSITSDNPLVTIVTP